MKTFRHSLIREFTWLGFAVTLVLVSISVIRMLVLLLGRAASGSIEPETVTALLGFTLIGYLPVILVPAVFMSILLSLSRSYRDSEMPVWFSSGLSLASWINPVLRFAIPIAVVSAFLSLFLTPWSLSKSAEYQRLVRSKDEVSRLSPGSFIESASSSRVFFIDKSTSDSEIVNNVFVQYNQDGRFGVVVAEKGYQQTAQNGDKFFVLLNGRDYEGTPGSLDFRVIDFERQMLRVEAREVAAETPSAKALTTEALLKDRTSQNMAELHWRIALPISGLVLALIAIPLSFVNPRSGRSWNLVLAILIFALYYYMLGAFQSWTAQGKLSPYVGLWPVHFAMLGTLLILFFRQLFSFRWLAFARK